MMTTRKVGLVGVCLLAVSTRAASMPRHGESTQLSRVASRSSVTRLSMLRGGELAPSVDILVTEEDLDVALEQAGNALVVVDFYAEWCGPCQKLAPVLEELAAKAPAAKVKFYKVDVDQSRELAAQKGIKSMPTINFYKAGQQVHQIIGGDKVALREQVAKATMPPIMRVLRSEKVLIVAGAVYAAYSMLIDRRLAFA